MRARRHIGTSGWHYKHWKGPFYPEDLPEAGFLRYYAERFHTVEINNSFYQLPREETLMDWRHTVQDDFIFSVKGSRFITHMKKLKDPERSLDPLMERIETLGDKLGPILFQLPPRWGFNPQRLTTFLDALPARYRYVMEFRDRSWINEKALGILAEHEAAFCIYEFDGYISPREATAEFVYIRLHGPEARYRGRYPDKTLEDWATSISTWNGEGKEVFCYFDNDEAGYAVENAMRLNEMLA